MSTLWKRALATTTIALVAGLGLTACDSGGTATTDTKDKDKGSQSQTENKPAASGVMTADDFSQRISDAQAKAGSTHFTQSMEAAGQKIEVTGDMIVSDDPSKVRMVMNMQGVEIRVVDGAMFMNMGELTGNKFYQPSMEDGNPIAEQLNSSIDQANVAKQMETLQAALKDFKAEEGAETIDGVETTKYTLVLDTQTLLDAQGTELPEGAPDLGDTVEYTIFAGSDDLPRRMVMNMAGTAVTMDFSKWGEAVSIEAPPADQITDKMPGM